jgi:hypothetical protein
VRYDNRCTVCWSLTECIALDRRGRRVTTCTASLTSSVEVPAEGGGKIRQVTMVLCNPKGLVYVDGELLRREQVAWLQR